MAAHDLQRLCGIEFNKLTIKLQQGLKQDIARIYSDSLFCDLKLVFGETSLHLNCCLLEVRAKSFYAHLCSIQQFFPEGCDLDITTVKRIKNFVRDVYERDDITTAERLLIEHLKDIEVSPDFDQYGTPLTSPSEIFNGENSFVLKPDHSYYSIAPLDWERELAEQDFLIESFCSILHKEQTKKKLRPQKSTSLNFNKYCSQQDSRSLLDLKRAVEEDSLLLQEEEFLYSNESSGFFDQHIFESKSKKIKCSVIYHRSRKLDISWDECGFFDAEESSSLCNDSLVDLPPAVSDKSKMSSNMDMGPDSGLATSAEDIPLDQESGLEASKSISSSVSSDCCVWDSTAVPQNIDVASWVDQAPHPDNTHVQADFVDRVLEELVGKSHSQSQRPVSSDVADGFTGLGVTSTPKHGFFIDASSLLDETEIATAKYEMDTEGSKSAAFYQSIDPCELLETGKPEKWQTTNRKSGVSSLPQIEENRVVTSCEERMAHKSQVNDLKGEKCENNSVVENEGSISKLHTCKEFVDDKPPSLIRSNTFELETEDGRLAFLRQDYERRQGSLIFQRCLSQSSGPLSDGGSEHDLNQHCTSLILPDLDPTLAMASMSLFPTHVVDEEIQTPDSLNNDLPGVGIMDTSSVGKSEGEGSQSPKQKDLENPITHGSLESLPPDLVSHFKSDVSSPLFSRRKTDSAPILSGAAPPLSPDKKILDKRMRNPLVSSASSAWVVDISDLTNSPEVRRRRADSSLDTSVSDLKDELSTSETKSSSSSLGFFIDLKDPQSSLDGKYDSIPKSEESKTSRQPSDSGKSGKQNACEFFVDLKHPTAPQKQPPKSEGTVTEKKLFSMFIDFGDKNRPKSKPELSSRSKTPISSLSTKVKIDSKSACEGTNLKESGSEAEMRGSNLDLSTLSHSLSSSTLKSNDPKKNSFYMFIDSESRSQKASTSGKGSIVQNIQNGKERSTSRIHHVRASSVSCVKNGPGLLSSSRNLNSQSLQSVELSSEIGDAVEKPMFISYHASLPIEEPQEGRMHKSEEEIGESSDVSSHMTTGSNGSSACSLETYSVHTPDQSSATDNYSSEKKDDFQSKTGKEEMLSEEQPQENNMNRKSLLTGGLASKPETILKLESKIAKSFVRLSDLDKEPMGISDQTTPSAAQRMSRSIPEASWIESKLLMSQSMGGGTVAMSSSSRSLSRLFPHLSMQCGNLGRSKTSSTCSPFTEDFDTMRSSQISDLSSMQSSTGLEYSTESTDVSSDRASPTTQLGDDLLKMFLEGINTDVIVEVGGRRIKAHKCILSSRCQYFAAVLSGGWVESAGNVISLQGFSYTVVHFALCHIYSGASTIPDQISIVELASLADMLSLEGLKDVIMYTLKVKYCHFFHKPCAVCSVGILECLPLAAAYGLDDIYRKSLRWITKYFVRIWPTKTFTALPRELMEKCYQQHIIHMTAENVLETILCCDKLLSIIPTVRWAEPVFVLTSRLMEMCIKFMSDNFSAVMSSDNFLSMGKEVPWNVGRFQESLVSACERMPPDQSCRSYKQLHSVLEVVQGPDPPPEMTWHPNFVELLIQLHGLSERTLIRQAARAARTPGWGQMSTELRRKIQDAACLVLAPADHASSRYKRNVSDGLRQSGQQSSYSRSLDLHQVKMAMAQHARRTNSNDQAINPVVVRKNIPSEWSRAVARRSAPVATNKPAERSTSVPSQGRPKTWPAQVKSRYLEKRPNHCKETTDSQTHKKRLDAPVPQRRVPPPAKSMFISSSDSSRNSSPAMKRSSNVISSSSKVTDSSTRTRAATVCNSSTSHLEASTTWKEDGITRSTDNIARHPLSTNVKTLSVTETTKTHPTVRKVKDSTSPEVPSQTKRDGTYSQTPSTLGTHSQSITMSNDSLATVSSSDDVHLTHSEKSQEARSSKVLRNSSRVHTNGQTKSDVNSPRTPLILTNKKASSSSVHKKTTVSKSITTDSNNTGTSRTPLSLVAKRSMSHNVKSPILSNATSRLAIPLRTSKSVSSVPDKGQIKGNVPSEGLTSRKQTSKDQPRNVLVSSKRASTGSSCVAASSLAGRVLSSNGSKITNSGNKSLKAKKTDKINGDSSLGSAVHPTVGPRSGTFLKDEPSILKAPVVENA